MRSKILIFSFIAFLPFILDGCANGYAQFYRPARYATPEYIAKTRVGPPTKTPIVEHSSPGNPKAIINAYAKRGYVFIGSSSFNSGRRQSDDFAVQQAQKVGADLVLIINPKYTGSVNSAVPITTPTTTTSYSTGTATAYGSGGYATAYGSGTTTTYGTRTTYIPITVNRYDYAAVYFIKKRFKFGGISRNLNDSEKQKIQSNKGVVLTVIVNKSPAYEADLLAGDIVIKVDGVRVENTDDFVKDLNSHLGERITLSIIRNNQHMNKIVQLLK